MTSAHHGGQRGYWLRYSEDVEAALDAMPHSASFFVSGCVAHCQTGPVQWVLTLEPRSHVSIAELKWVTRGRDSVRRSVVAWRMERHRNPR